MATLAWDPTESTINLGDEFSAPTLSATVEGTANAEALAAVTYTSDNEGLLNYVDGTWNFTPNVAGTATITASIPSDNEIFSSNEAKYTLTVVDPNAVNNTVINHTFFNYTGSAYEAKTNTDNGFTFSSVYSGSSSELTFNTGNKNGGVASGVVVSAVNSSYIITSIDIEMTSTSGSLGLNAYSRATAFDALVKGTAPTVPSDAKKLNSSAIQSSTTVNINDNAFAILPSATGVIHVKKVTVHYKKAEATAPEAVVVTAGDRTFENDGDYEIEAGTVVNIAAEGATSIKIEAGDGSEAIVSEGASTTWTPAVGEYIPTITATNEAGSVDITFTLTVTASKQPNGLAYETTTFELTTANAGDFSAPELTNPYNLPVTYSSSNEDLAVVMEDGQVIVDSKPGTATITATFAGNDTYSAGSVSYTINVTKVYTSIADVLTADNNTEIRFDFPMTVGYVSGNYCYVTDGKGGYILVFGNNNNINYSANDVIPAGWTAKYTVYNGLPEIATKGYTLPESTETGTYEIATVNAADLASQPLCRIVKVEGVTFTEATPATNSEFTGTSAETTIGFYNQMKLASVAAGDYDVTVIVSVFDKTATAIAAPGQFIPVEYYLLPIDAPTIKIDGVEFTDFDTAIDLQKGTKTVTITATDESHHIYHKHSATGNAENVAPLADTEDGYTWVQSHTADIPVSLNGTLSFYAQHPVSGAKSEVKTLTFVGDSTAIFEVEAGVSGEAEWFDLTGRRVAKPAKGGVYIIKEGSKTSKRAF